MEKVLDKIIKYALLSLVFLLPLWFLPWTVSPIAINKQMLLSVFVFLLLILWLVKTISSGKLSCSWGKLSTGVILLLLVFGISTVFSSARIQSFWGMADEPDTFFNFILYGLVFFLFANLISVNQLSSVLIIFLASSGILSLLFLIQIFKPIFPWDFAQSSGFNPVGSVQALAVFLGGAFVILMAALTSTKLQRLYQILGGIIGILLFIAIFLVNFWAVWLGIVFGMAIIIFSKLKNLSIASVATGANPLKPLFLPLFIFALALVFIFLKLPIGNIVSLPSEISPTFKATLDIATKSLAESPKNLILGSGPATFGYQYSLHRGIGPNLTDFWQLRFNQGAAALPTFLATFGILGILAILLTIAIFLYQGLKKMYKGPASIGAELGVFAGGFYYLICWFLYPINLSLLFTIFLMLGLWVVLTGEKKKFLFTQSPQKAFTIMLLGVFLIAGSIFGLYTVSQKYAAAVIYNQGLNLINAAEPKLDEGIIAINKAVTLDLKDSYLRNLSQAFLFKINEVLNNQELSQEQGQAEFQKQVSNAELSATAAVQINPRNSQNWLQLGNVYENLALFNVEGTRELALLDYQKASELDPQNPLLPFNLGRTYKSTAERIQIQIALLEQAQKKDEEAINKLQESYDKNLELALAEFKKSNELKSNFSVAYYLTAQVYEIQGKTAEALQNYQIVLQLEPDNKEIQKKVEELSK